MIILYEEYGNLSVDFMFSIFLFLLILGGLTFLIADRYDMVEGTQELAQSKNIVEEIAYTINQVYSGGEGHSISLYLPPNINNKEYKVTVNSTGVIIKLEGRRGWALIVPKRFSNTISLESSTINMLPGRNYQVLNMKDENGFNWIVIKEIKE